MIGIAIALVVVGAIVIFIFPIIGIAVGAIGVLLLIGAVIARSRRAAADSGP